MIKTVIEKLYPSTKICFALWLSIAVLLLDTLLFSGIVFMLLIILYVITNETKVLIKTVKRLLILIFFMITMRALFTNGQDYLISVGSIKIYQEGLRLGIMMALNVTVFVLSLTFAFHFTQTKDLVAALENAGFSPKSAFVILSAFNMIPEMTRRSQVIMEAQSCRGVEVEGNLWIRTKAFIPMLGPLMLSSIAVAEERVITLEARGFSSDKPKTRLYDLKKSKLDKILFVMICLMWITLIVGKVMLWLKLF